MEDVLSVYQRPYDPEIPVVCMDEQPMQLTKETRIPQQQPNLENPNGMTMNTNEMAPPASLCFVNPRQE